MHHFMQEWLGDYSVCIQKYIIKRKKDERFHEANAGGKALSDMQFVIVPKYHLASAAQRHVPAA